MEINYVLPIGRRCNCSDFVRKNNLSRFASPMDYMFISIDVAIKVINNKFEDFLNDIVIKEMLLFPKNTTDVKKDFFDEYNYLIPYYFCISYDGYNIYINQNYLPSDINPHIYEWERLCVFIHHDLECKDLYNTIKRRCDTMNKCLENDKTLLLYMTSIVRDPEFEKQRILDLCIDFKYNLFVVIFTCTNYKLGYEIKNNIHFYSMLVPTYDEQLHTNGDNNFGTFNNKEIMDKLNEVFNFKLLDKPI